MAETSIDENVQRIADAIDNCHQVTAIFGGGPDDEPRVFCPNALGVNGYGEPVVLVHQLSGASESGLERGQVRVLNVARMEILSTEPGEWVTVPGNVYNTNHFKKGRITKVSRCRGDADRVDPDDFYAYNR